MDDQFLDSLQKSFLNQTTLNVRKEKWTFLNQEFIVKALLFSNDQKPIRGARKLTFLPYWWNFDIEIHKTSLVKKVHFPSTSMVNAKKKRL